MGQYSFKLPDLGEGIVESEISKWYIQAGDRVEEDQHIADVLTDKAMVELSSPVSGTILSIACQAGEVLAVGSELVLFEVEGEGNKAAQGDLAETTGSQPKEEREASDKNEGAKLHASETEGVQAVGDSGRWAEKLIRHAEPAGSGGVLASPSVRQRARDEGVDLTIVPGSGPAGRISHKDLDAFVAAGGELAVHRLRRPKLRTTDIKIQGVRRAIARKMEQSTRRIPHYSYIEEVDVTQLEELRQHLNSERNLDQPKLTLLPFLLQALINVLPHYPHCNARYDDDADILTQYEGVHAGIATMTVGGLMVPVIKHCESLDLWQMASEIARVSQAARDGTARAEMLSGSTITLTSLGPIGGIATTPVINAPETSIIGVNKMQERPVVRNGMVVVRNMMNLSASFDHRIVDGFDGAQFVQALKKLLENPTRLFI